MLYLILSIICSAVNIWIFKIYEKFEINVFQAIVVNYFVCVAMGLLFTEVPISANAILNSSWLWVSACLGVLFIGGFNLIAITTQRAGVAVVTVASKVSMVMPIAVAIMFYGDAFSFQKLIGILMVIGAILFTSVKDFSELNTLKKVILLPLLVWISSGIIEIILDYVQNPSGLNIKTQEFPSFLVANFGLAGLIGLVILIGLIITGKNKLGLKHIFAGVCLGMPNYGSLYFLLLGLKESGLESSAVFPITNIGIVLLAIIGGVLFFKEKLSSFNLIGVGLAIGAIVLLTLV